MSEEVWLLSPSYLFVELFQSLTNQLANQEYMCQINRFWYAKRK
jgi:hypothetical protein